MAVLLSKAIHGSLPWCCYFLMGVDKYRRNWFTSLAWVSGFIGHSFLEWDLRAHCGF